jgi:signal transduction histidine kinase
MSPDRLANIIRGQKDYLLREMKRLMGELPWFCYQDYYVRTKQGEERLATWLDLVIKALDGDAKHFFQDQSRMGYARADQPTALQDAFHMYQIFKHLVFEIIQLPVAPTKTDRWNLHNDMHKLNDILQEGYANVTFSFLKTREEQISEKVSHLNELQEFTREIISTPVLDRIAKTVLGKAAILFGVKKTYLIICERQALQKIYGYPDRRKSDELLPIMKKSWKEGVSVTLGLHGNESIEVDLFPLKTAVSVPIYAHGQSYGALALVSKPEGFKFAAKDLSFLNQFLHITAIALENVFILEEIQRSRYELQLLTNKMITIQEEERRRLAEDIHDTIAQTLTGISYKMQYCKELAARGSQSLTALLDKLISAVQESIRKSRELISSLRPDLIDTIGLVPALHRFFDNFSEQTGIRISERLPIKLHISPEVDICLFRVIQEALTNIYKHSNATNAEVALEARDDNIMLVVVDHGRGFTMSQGAPWLKDETKLGLLSMKKRIDAVGGTLVIDAAVNHGCLIKATIPLNREVSRGEKDQSYDR